MPVIKNMTFTSLMATDPVDLQCQLGFQPDEAIVRQITFVSTTTKFGVLLLWCSLTNDYIGSFHNQAQGVITYPNTKIAIKSNVATTLSFRVDAAAQIIVPQSGFVGAWAVQIDFIKY